MRASGLFRSKSCTVHQITAAAAAAINSSSPSAILKSSFPHSRSRYHHHHHHHEEEEEEEEDDDEEGEEKEEEGYDEEEDRVEEGYVGDNSKSLATTPFIGLEERRRRRHNRSSSTNRRRHHHRDCNSNQFPQGPGGIMGIVVAALRKSLLVTCSGLDMYMDMHKDNEVFSSNMVMDIGLPTDVRHVSHVTFDPFHGFLGLPLDLQYNLPSGYVLPSARSNLILIVYQYILLLFIYFNSSGMFRHFG